MVNNHTYFESKQTLFASNMQTIGFQVIIKFKYEVDNIGFYRIKLLQDAK